MDVSFLEKALCRRRLSRTEFNQVLAHVHPHPKVEIVKRSDQARALVVLPKRWIVERTFARLNRCRGLAKEWENLTRNGAGILAPSIRLMLGRLCNPA